MPERQSPNHARRVTDAPPVNPDAVGPCTFNAERPHPRFAEPAGNSRPLATGSLKEVHRRHDRHGGVRRW